MQSFLNQLGTRQFIPLWLLLILAVSVTLISFVIHYRDGGKWWLRTNVALFVFVVSPTLIFGVCEIFGRLFDWLGLPSFLVWAIGMAGAELVVMGGYGLLAVSVLLGVGTVANKRASLQAKIAAVSASLIACLFIALYLYGASHPQHM